MLQNTVKSFVYHVAACFIASLLLRPFAPYVDEQMTLAMYGYLLFAFLLVAGFYVWGGTTLTPSGSSRKDWLTVATIAIPGLLLWFSFFFLPGGGDLEWILFFMYYHSMRPLGELLVINTQTIQLVFNLVVAILPSILLGIGLRIKRKKR